MPSKEKLALSIAKPSQYGAIEKPAAAPLKQVASMSFFSESPKSSRNEKSMGLASGSSSPAALHDVHLTPPVTVLAPKLAPSASAPNVTALAPTSKPVPPKIVVVLKESQKKALLQEQANDESDDESQSCKWLCFKRP